MTALTDLLQEIMTEIPGLMLQLPETEAIHRFRLRIKQLRALEKLQGQEMAWRCMADVYRAAGALRDLEHWLQFTRDTLGTGHLMYRHLLQTRPARINSLEAALRECDRRAFLAAVKALESDLHNASANEAARVWRHCRIGLRKARFRLRNARHREEALHAARKALKQSWFLLQCFYPAEMLKPMRDLEQDIGRWHDEWDWCRQAAAVMGSSGKEAFPDKQAKLKTAGRQLRRRVLAFRLRRLGLSS